MGYQNTPPKYYVKSKWVMYDGRGDNYLSVEGISTISSRLKRAIETRDRKREHLSPNPKL